MKKRNLLSAFGLTTVAAGLCLLQIGCEVDSADTVDIQITPPYAEIRRGQSLELTASGWDTYEWSIGNRQLGHLSKTYGRTVVYTATRGATTEERSTGGTNGTETVAVDTFNTITAAAVTGSLTNDNGYSTSMRIKHLPD